MDDVAQQQQLFLFGQHNCQLNAIVGPLKGPEPTKGDTGMHLKKSHYS